MPVNKVVYGGRTLIDLTSDTITPNVLLSGYTAHAKNGAQITGTFVDTSASDEIKQILTHGLTETLVIKNSNVSGLKVTKSYSNDDLVCTAILTNQNGVEIGRTIKTFSNNSLVITTIDNTNRKLVETFTSDLTSCVSILTNSSGVQLGKVTKSFTTTDAITTTSYSYVL